jgi:hypothetical protein
LLVYSLHNPIDLMGAGRATALPLSQ